MLNLRVYQGFMMPINHQAGYIYLKTMLKILVGRAVMHHVSSLQMVFALTLDRFMCCVSHHNNLCKQSVPRSPLYVQFFQTDFLIFERSKGTEQKKIDRPHIELVSCLNNLEFGPFSALSTCANEVVVIKEINVLYM